MERYIFKESCGQNVKSYDWNINEKLAAPYKSEKKSANGKHGGLFVWDKINLEFLFNIFAINIGISIIL